MATQDLHRLDGAELQRLRCEALQHGHLRDLVGCGFDRLRKDVRALPLNR